MVQLQGFTPQNLGFLINFQSAATAGLADPGQTSGLTLTQIAVTALLGPRLDDIVKSKIAIEVNRTIPQAFWKADLELRRDHRKHHGKPSKTRKKKRTANSRKAG